MIKYLILLILSIQFTFAGENSSRIATVNYQQVLVDPSSSAKGEGLRFFLERDPLAKKYLDEYQNRSKPSIQSASLGTIGAVLLLSGFLNTNSKDSGDVASRQNLLFGGVFFLGVSYLISRTIQYNNENLLNQAVDEYNKRNSPKIFFSTGFNVGQGGGIGLSKDF